VVEIWAISDNMRSGSLCKAAEEWRVLAQEMANAQKTKEILRGASGSEDDPTLFESLSMGPRLWTHVEKTTDFLD
jgi:hypothetical protein